MARKSSSYIFNVHTMTGILQHLWAGFSAAAVIHQYEYLNPPPWGIEGSLSVHNIKCQNGDRRSERAKDLINKMAAKHLSAQRKLDSPAYVQPNTALSCKECSRWLMVSLQRWRTQVCTPAWPAAQPEKTEKTTGSGSKVTQAVLVQLGRKILSRLPITSPLAPGTWWITLCLNSRVKICVFTQAKADLVWHWGFSVPVHTELLYCANTNTLSVTDVCIFWDFFILQW